MKMKSDNSKGCWGKLYLLRKPNLLSKALNRINEVNVKIETVEF